ncbi:membrane transport protein mmpL8 [bacterium BMS3Bbin02]|nr:membrane transport protein mmpL8 [bacterium BMS3Bbin02]
MRRFVQLLATLVRKSPVAILVGSVALTVVFGVFAGQQVQAEGNEGFSPDSAEFRAFDTIAEYFSDNSEEPVQVVVQARSGNDLFTAAALREYVTTIATIEQSRAGELMVGRPGGDVIGFFTPVIQALEGRATELGISFDMLLQNVTDDDVKQAFFGAMEQLPPDVAGVFPRLFGEGADLTVPTADTGLIVMFLNVSDLDDPDQTILQSIEVDMADKVEGLDTEVTDASAFSFALLFSDQDETTAEIGRLFGFAFIIIILILVFVYWFTPPPGRAAWSLRRAVADMSLTMLVIVMSITWMNGIGVLFGPKYLGFIGNFSPLLQIVPILLIGLGVDYAIHTTARYREELHEGETVDGAATNATLTVGIALVLATATTAVGFLTNITNPVTALKDFGIVASIGIISAFILMLTVVPSIRVLLDRRAEKRGVLPVESLGTSANRFLPKLIGRTAFLAERLAVPTLLVAALLGGIGAYGLTRLDTTFSFTDFLPDDSPRLVTFETITDKFGGGFGEETEVIIESDTVASVATHNALVAALGNLASTENVLQFGDQAAAESPVSVIAQLVSPTEIQSEEFMQYAFANGLRQDLTVAPGTDVAALYDKAVEIVPQTMARVLAKVNGSYRFMDIGVSTQAGESGARQLNADLRAAFAPVENLEGTTVVATNQNIVSDGVIQALGDSQVSSLFLTIIAAMTLLVITFAIEARRPFLGVITILPVVLIVLWVFGMMSLTGIPFNPVTAMIANIAIGIGVPYSIHITHRYQGDRDKAESAEVAIRETATHTGGALAGSAFTTAAGFGILVTASLLPFRQLGLVTVYAIVFALLASVLVLPSMLILWDRWHAKRGHSAVDHTR